MGAPICYIDTETTGVHPQRQVWEIALIHEEHGEYAFFVDVELDQADPGGLNVGRFYERHPWGRYLAGTIPDPFIEIKSDGEFLRRRGAAEVVARWTHGASLIGAVPSFDERTLDPLLRRHGLVPAWHYHPIDIEAMAVGWLLGSGSVTNPAGLSLKEISQECAPPWNSTELSRACGVELPSEDERHTALGDARWVKRWYEAITKGAQ